MKFLLLENNKEDIFIIKDIILNEVEEYNINIIENEISFLFI